MLRRFNWKKGWSSYVNNKTWNITETYYCIFLCKKIIWNLETIPTKLNNSSLYQQNKLRHDVIHKAILQYANTAWFMCGDSLFSTKDKLLTLRWGQPRLCEFSTLRTDLNHTQDTGRKGSNYKFTLPDS